MTAKHTPGPWVFEGINSGYISDNCAVPLASLRHYHNDDEGTANGNLIAAAPELLESLEVIKEAIAMNVIDMDTLCQIEEAFKNKFDAVIAKAKGET